MIILVSLCLFFFLEAWLEEVVIKLKDTSLPNYYELNQEEHKRSLVVASLLVLFSILILISYEKAYYLIVPAIISRRVFFDFSLILLRNRPLDTYEGNNGTDSILSKIFGRHGRIKELVLEVLIIIIFIGLHFVYDK